MGKDRMEFLHDIVPIREYLKMIENVADKTVCG